MPALPFTSANPSAIYFQHPMSPALASQRSRSGSRSDDPASADASANPSTTPSSFPKPLYRIHLNDIAHPGTSAFLSVIDAAKALEDAVSNVLGLLYDVHKTESPLETSPDPAARSSTSTFFASSSAPAPTPSRAPGISLAPRPVDTSSSTSDSSSNATRPHPPSHPAAHFPPVRSITLVLRPMDGVAYTTGKTIDPEHKEIHFSLNYIGSRSDAFRKDESRYRQKLRQELEGVLTHEMVHVWQWDGRGTCPGGLVEGVADWVRLRAGLGAGHWREVRSPGFVEGEGKDVEGGGKEEVEGGWGWDAGYEKTGFFLDWLEKKKCGEGTVRRLNAWLRGREYVQDGEKGVWTAVCGEEVKVLWRQYQQWLKSKEK